MDNSEPGWDLYRSFLAVLRLGSLSAAGRALGLTQPTVGRHIAMLQAALGGRVLFTRSQTGLMPTAAAHELHPHAEDMAAAAAAFVRMGSGNLEETAGVVRIAAADVVGVEVLPAILSDFRYAHPNIVIELSVSNQMADLLRRDADIAVRMVRPKQKALLAKRAGRIALGFYAHRRYLERYGYPERLEDLGHHTLIGFDRVSPGANFIEAAPVPVSRELSRSAVTTTWPNWPRCAPDSELEFATPESPAAIPISCRSSASISGSSWKSGSSCTMS